MLHTIGEETEEDKETQVFDPLRSTKKSFLYRKLNYCYDNFYKVFFGEKDKEFGSDFEKYDDDGIYEDIDTRNWGLDVIQEESDSDYYRSLDYCNVTFDKLGEVKKEKDDSLKGSDFEAILENCEGYLQEKAELNNGKKDSPKLYPKTIQDKIYNFKKDFSNHDYVNVNFDKKSSDYENVNLDRRTKNEILREQFFTDKNVINAQINKIKDKTIECHSIRNDVTKTGPDVKVSGSLNMKLINLDKYNRVLTTTETFMENSEASFTKNEINKDFETFVKRSEKYYTSENRERKTTVELTKENKPKTEIRIIYNPTFKTTRNMRGFCQYCKRKCPRTDEKCCPKCVCLENEIGVIWRENWLNILLFLAMIFAFIALAVQSFVSKDVCEKNGTVVDDGKCFEMI